MSEIGGQRAKRDACANTLDQRAYRKEVIPADIVPQLSETVLPAASPRTCKAPDPERVKSMQKTFDDDFTGRQFLRLGVSGSPSE